MAIEKIEYRDAPINIEPLKAKVNNLEEEIATLKKRTTIAEVEIEKLKPK